MGLSRPIQYSVLYAGDFFLGVTCHGTTWNIKAHKLEEVAEVVEHKSQAYSTNDRTQILPGGFMGKCSFYSRYCYKLNCANSEKAQLVTIQYKR